MMVCYISTAAAATFSDFQRIDALPVAIFYILSHNAILCSLKFYTWNIIYTLLLIVLYLTNIFCLLYFCEVIFVVTFRSFWVSKHAFAK